jgi:uncharacterized protein GlcG (DUF336 family)
LSRDFIGPETQKIAWDSIWGDPATEADALEGREPEFPFRATLIRKDTVMDLLTFAKNIADRVEAQSARAKVPVAVCVIDIHGNIILKHRMSGAPTFSIELSERKAYTSALVGLRTADLFPLVQPGQELFPLMGLSEGRFCSMGGGAPLTSEGQLVAGVGVSGGSVEQDVGILESALREAVRPALTATS